MQIDYKQLKNRCLTDIKAYASLGDIKATPFGNYVYIDNNSDILAVCHLDTVLSLKHFYVNRIGDDDIIVNAQLDDRLGAYIILDLLPSLGLKYDILLTEGEESGLSTAQYFDTLKAYKWVFSFDRHGDDVVLYQYHGKKWESALKASGFRVGIGSFSDIAFLDHLGVKCVNVGTGYEGEHSKLCYASANVLKHQVKRFIDFYHKNKKTRYDHEPNTHQYGKNYPIKYDWDAWGEYDNFYCYLCNERAGTRQVVNDIWLCESCFNDAEICQGCQNIVYNHELTGGLCVDCTEGRTIYDEQG